MPNQECPFPEFERAFGLWGRWDGPQQPKRKRWPYADYYEGRVATRTFLFFPHDPNCMGEIEPFLCDEAAFTWRILGRGELCRLVTAELARPRDIVSGRVRIWGQFLMRNWPTGTLVINRVAGALHTCAPINDPVAIRIWGDYLLDVETRPYLLDYLTDRSETFAQWMKELPE